jgi:tRNA dimethylallyltransferase
VIEENPHARVTVEHIRSCRRQTPLSVAKHQLHLLTRHSRKPFEEIVDARAVLEVFKQRSDGNARLPEQPFAAAFSGRAFDCRALAPIEHEAILAVLYVNIIWRPRHRQGEPSLRLDSELHGTEDPNPVAEPEIILIAGPTASGKSALALALAEQRGGVIVNADSMQVYGDLRIITARPTLEDEARAPHRLYGFVDAAENYSVGRWCGDAAAVLADAALRSRAKIFVGGTGLYFKALLTGLAAVPPIPPEIRSQVRARLLSEGAAALHAELKSRDPEAAARLMPNDRSRVSRALEVMLATDRSLVAWHDSGLPAAVDPARAAKIFLAPDRDALLRRIDARFDAMLASGALDEVRALAARKLDKTLPAMKAHGVPWLMRYLDGAITLEEVAEGGKRDTRRYTKRQDTWFRNQLPDFVWVEPERAADAIEAQLRALAR